MKPKHNQSKTATLVIATSILALPALTVAQTDGTQVAYRPATTRAVGGFDRIVTRDGTTLFLADALHVRDRSDESTRTRSGKADASKLSLDFADAASLVALVRDHGVDRLAVVDNDRIVGTVAIVGIDERGVSVSPVRTGGADRQRRTSSPMDEVSQQGSTITIVPRASAVRPGQSITADVYAADIRGLRTFQVAVDAARADGAKLELESAEVDRTRQDHVFFGQDALDAADLFLGRVGAVLFHDSATADGTRHLGTFTFTTGANTEGTYHLTLRQSDSFLNDADGRDLEFSVRGAAVKVGSGVSKGAIRQRE